MSPAVHLFLFVFVLSSVLKLKSYFILFLSENDKISYFFIQKKRKILFGGIIYSGFFELGNRTNKNEKHDLNLKY